MGRKKVQSKSLTSAVPSSRLCSAFEHFASVKNVRWELSTRRRAPVVESPIRRMRGLGSVARYLSCGTQRHCKADFRYAKPCDKPDWARIRKGVNNATLSWPLCNNETDDFLGQSSPDVE